MSPGVAESATVDRERVDAGRGEPRRQWIPRFAEFRQLWVADRRLASAVSPGNITAPDRDPRDRQDAFEVFSAVLTPGVTPSALASATHRDYERLAEVANEVLESDAITAIQMSAVVRRTCWHWPIESQLRSS